LLAHKIFRLYGQKTVEIITKNPYRLAQEVWGVGFTTADQIAANLGIKADSPLRLKAGILYTIQKAAEGEGHCFLTGTILSERAKSLLELEDNIDLSPFVDELKTEGDLIDMEGNYYLPALDRAEDSVAYFVSKRCQALSNTKIPESLVTDTISQIIKKLSFDFSVEQKEAVYRSIKYPLLVITGGPGCGKTTIIQAITAAYEAAGQIIKLAAPTGRAAQRMSQVCALPASTIHRLLKFDPIKRGFIHGPKDPLIADIIIVDEASMIDIYLAQSLFSAISDKTTIILVGDKDQLPSVGPGRILGDLLSLTEIQSISLSRIFRRKEESSINDIAHAINSGNVPNIPVPDGETKADAYFIPKSEPEEITSLVRKLVAEQIPKKFGISAQEIVVLTPSNRGPLGTIALNQQLQAHLNPPGSIDSEQEIEVGETILRIGDRVCQRVNNYQIDEAGVFNGDTGQVYSIDKYSGRLTVELWDGRLIDYERAELPQLALAYAVTVHRSQGSEIPCVVMVLHDSHYALLERQLVYTGVTRAKKLLIIVGSKRALAIASKRTNTHRRLTRLPLRIRELIGEY
ncbi:MAG: AAA family ATPase, partial [bacterium]|nr:AAA family ATPase [bacterium]